MQIDVHGERVGVRAEGHGDFADDRVGLGRAGFAGARGHVEKDRIVADIEGDAGGASEGFEGLAHGAVVGAEGDDGDGGIEAGFGDKADAGGVGQDR